MHRDPQVSGISAICALLLFLTHPPATGAAMRSPPSAPATSSTPSARSIPLTLSNHPVVIEIPR